MKCWKWFMTGWIGRGEEDTEEEVQTAWQKRKLRSQGETDKMVGLANGGVNLSWIS